MKYDPHLNFVLHRDRSLITSYFQMSGNAIFCAKVRPTPRRVVFEISFAEVWFAKEVVSLHRAESCPYGSGPQILVAPDSYSQASLAAIGLRRLYFLSWYGE